MRYLRARFLFITALALIVVATALTAYLNRVPVAAWIDGFLLSGIAIVILVSADARAYYRRLRLFQNSDALLRVDLDSKRLEAGDALLLKRLQELEGKMREIEIGGKRREDEQLETLQLWTHQIKTPLTGLDLLLQVEPLDREKARLQIAIINRYLEMVLVYLKLDSVNTDLVFERIDLSKLIKSLVRELAPLFIEKDVAVEIGELPAIVGDSQWLRFIFEQLLTNAIKYSDSGAIRVFSRGDAIYVEDSGRGIAANDLPRVFERGYSGENGRLSENASGLGLYLSQQVARRMNLRLTIDSTVGAGTTVGVHFDQEKRN